MYNILPQMGNDSHQTAIDDKESSLSTQRISIQRTIFLYLKESLHNNIF